MAECFGARDDIIECSRATGDTFRLGSRHESSTHTKRRRHNGAETHEPIIKSVIGGLLISAFTANTARWAARRQSFRRSAPHRADCRHDARLAILGSVS